MPHAGRQASVAVTLADDVARAMGRRNVGGRDRETHTHPTSRE